MKKILMLFVAIFTFATLSFSQTSGSFGIQGGYSWIDGVAGAQLQMGHFAINAGYFPATMPGSGDPIPSFSGALTYYTGNWDESSYYAKIGVASAGYRYQESWNGGAWGGNVVKPMTIFMAGVKYVGKYSNWYSKGGVGLGWCSEATVFTWELCLGYQFGW